MQTRHTAARVHLSPRSGVQGGVETGSPSDFPGRAQARAEPFTAGHRAPSGMAAAAPHGRCPVLWGQRPGTPSEGSFLRKSNVPFLLLLAARVGSRTVRSVRHPKGSVNPTASRFTVDRKALDSVSVAGVGPRPRRLARTAFPLLNHLRTLVRTPRGTTARLRLDLLVHPASV